MSAGVYTAIAFAAWVLVTLGVWFAYLREIEQQSAPQKRRETAFSWLAMEMMFSFVLVLAAGSWWIISHQTIAAPGIVINHASPAMMHSWLLLMCMIITAFVAFMVLAARTGRADPLYLGR